MAPTPPTQDDHTELTHVEIYDEINNTFTTIPISEMIQQATVGGQAEAWGLALSPTLANPEQAWGPIHFSDGMPEYGEIMSPSN